MIIIEMKGNKIEIYEIIDGKGMKKLWEWCAFSNVYTLIRMLVPLGYGLRIEQLKNKNKK